MSIRYSKYLAPLVFICDLLLLNVALYSSHLIIKPTGAIHISPIFNLMVNMAWVIVSLASKSFDVKRPLVLKDNINKYLLTLIYHLVLVLGIIYFFKIYDVSRAVVIMAYSLFTLLILLQRSILFFCLDFYRKKGYNHRKVLIIGDETIAARLVKSFSQHPEYGYDLDDFLSEAQISDATDEIYKSILAKKPDEIFICYKHMDADLLNNMIRFGNENFIKIKVVSDLVLIDNYAKLVNYDNVPVLQVNSNPEISLKIRFLKRSFDILFASVVMLLGAPCFALIYFITKFSSKGPAFYSQERIGRNEKPFYIYKFRSMYVNAENLGPQLSKDNDPRITKWGMIMRKTRLDELPQFYNVLKGEMSVVGPRPERQHFIEKIIEKTPNYKKLLRLKPGITSMGQVHYGYAENIDQMRERIKYDMLYLQNITLNSDLDIIMRTVKVMVQRKGK